MAGVEVGVGSQRSNAAPTPSAPPVDPLEPDAHAEQAPRDRHGVAVAVEARVAARAAELDAARTDAERRARAAEALAGLSRELMTADDPAGALATHAHALVEVCGADALAWCLPERRIAATWGGSPSLPRSLEGELVRTFVARSPTEASYFVEDCARLSFVPPSLLGGGLSGVARVRRGGAVVAAFRFGRPTPWTETERAALESVVEMCEVVAARAARAKELRANAIFAEATLGVVSLMDDDLPTDEMARRAIGAIGPLLDVEWACVAQRAGSQLYGRPTVGAGLLPELEALLVGGLPDEGGPLEVALHLQAPVFVDDGAEDADATLAAVGARSCAIVPVDADTVLFAVRLFHPRPWHEREQRLLEAAARAVRGAAQRGRARKQLEEAAMSDVLTGLRNRRAFDADLAAELADAARHRFPVSVLFIDVDGLKRVNDEQGHEAGDALLRAAASALVCGFRTSDRVYRLGGDEYAVLLGHTGPEAAEAIGRRVRRAAADVARATPGADLSAGMASYPAEVSTDAELRKLADSRMYADKAEHKRVRAARR